MRGGSNESQVRMMTLERSAGALSVVCAQRPMQSMIYDPLEILFAGATQETRSMVREEGRQGLRPTQARKRMISTGRMTSRTD